MKTAKNKQAQPEEKLSTGAAAKEAFMPVVRELVRAYQAFRSYSDADIRQLGLTSSQFDAIATLGNTPGMTFKQLAEKTLTTKGELTGIIDRLEKKGLVRREVPPEDRRSFIAVLTPEGERVFQETFPAHIAHLKQRFEQLDRHELEEIRVALEKIRNLF
ncbi:MAG TPA: MarR family transcriptional regulator [Leptolyngbyaceae cyanobacterium]